MTVVTQKGQVTIPKDVRKVLDVGQGDEVVFEVEENRVIVRKKERKAQFRKYVGFLKNKEGLKVNDIICTLREGK